MESSNINSAESEEIPLDELHIRIQESVYSPKAVLLTCYWYTDKAFVFISTPSEGELDIRFRSKGNPQVLSEISDEFMNSLLENELRVQVEAETASVREIIIAGAFADRLQSLSASADSALHDAP